MAKKKRIVCKICNTPRDEDEYCIYCGIDTEGGVDETVKFAWAFLILYGKPTDGSWSYYGGSWDNPSGMGWKELEELTNTIREKVVSIGIDWQKTTMPYVSDESVFNGTFDSAGSCQATLGNLVLKNGETYKLGSDDSQAAHLVETARAMMNKKHSDVQKLAEKL